MSLERLKAALKPVLIRIPGVGPLAQKSYGVMKAKEELRRLKARHPGVEIIYYSSEERKALLKQGFNSQHGQDHYLWTRHFDGREAGVFVEIGCALPFVDNNSAYIEKQGWTGFAIDAQDKCAPLWTERKTPFLNAAVSDRSASRDFIRFTEKEGWEYNLGGFADVAQAEDLAAYDHEVMSMDCAPLAELLPDLQSCDLLMIDVEGAEEEVLRGVDLEKLQPRCILIENNRVPGGDESVRSHVCGRGYRFAARIDQTDDVFVLEEGQT
ncbi:MAG: FkbM family methyltransferase [Paracoccaceae bacterium]|nr:FkbM family methyltransferase [Paracoccaceae bacterium]MDG1370957.1 FkbM family methyltransferase [Paracoccaceae bacterium]